MREMLRCVLVCVCEREYQAVVDGLISEHAKFFVCSDLMVFYLTCMLVHRRIVPPAHVNACIYQYEYFHCYNCVHTLAPVQLRRQEEALKAEEEVR